jgi:hypothetical protein
VFWNPLALLHLLHPLSASNNDLLLNVQARLGVVLSDLSLETPPEIALKRQVSKFNRNNKIILKTTD